MEALHCFDFLAGKPAEVPSTVVLSGDDRFLLEKVLKRLYLCITGNEEPDAPIHKFSGGEIQWRDLSDELATGSLFSQGRSQPVVVQDAGPFISQYRSELERWVSGPDASSTLILMSDSWLKTTKLHKLVEEHGLRIECGAPIMSGNRKSVDQKKLCRWIASWAQSHYRLQMDVEVSGLLWELSQDDFGMVDTSLAKLSLLLEPDSQVTVADIRQHVGGWKAESVWKALDEALDGNAAGAIATLHPIFHSGEHPLGVMGQLSWSLRRFAVAYDHFNQARATQRGRADIKESLKAAGFQSWSGELDKAAGRLKRLGRRRLDVLHRWLLEVDLALKGSHAREDQGRQLIERLLVQLAVDH